VCLSVATRGETFEMKKAPAASWIAAASAKRGIQEPNLDKGPVFIPDSGACHPKLRFPRGVCLLNLWCTPLWTPPPSRYTKINIAERGEA
jgi:hypothetical protein